MADITVPVLGESVTEATVGQWLKTPGEAVEKDEALVAELELSRREGLFLGPEAATGLVGIRKAIESGAVDANSSIVLVGTGSGLKSLSLLSDPLSAHR